MPSISVNRIFSDIEEFLSFGFQAVQHGFRNDKTSIARAQLQFGFRFAVKVRASRRQQAEPGGELLHLPRFPLAVGGIEHFYPRQARFGQAAKPEFPANPSPCDRGGDGPGRGGLLSEGSAPQPASGCDFFPGNEISGMVAQISFEGFRQGFFT